MRLACAPALVLLAVAPLAAAAEPITIGQTVKLTSRILGEERTVLVSTPAGYERGQDRYPVLYMTDGDAHLTHTRGTVDFLSLAGLMPDVIIVGLTNTDRTRDLTPTHAFDTLPDGTRRENASSGGAGRFLDFFERELIPYVEGHYRTAPYRILAGHSLGGLFALHALVARTEIFNAIIAASPALMWDGDLILRQAADFLKDRKELSRTVFVAMANEEAGEPAPHRFDRLCTSFRSTKAAGFVWDSRLMTDETHGTVSLRAYYWGLRAVFAGWQLPADPRTHPAGSPLLGLKQHYADLSRRFGFSVLPPEQVVNQVGYELLGADKLEDAIAVFRFNVEIYPASANVHDSLGEALQRAGRLDEALASYTRAVETAKRTGDRLLDAFTRNRDRAAAARRP